MGKYILMLLLAVVSESAMAAWTEVDDNNNFTVYADFFTIRKLNNKVRMWSMHDYKQEQVSGGFAYRSTKFQYEFDCQKDQARMLAFSLHAANMGGGEVLYSDSIVGKWEPAISGSLNEARWKSICGTPNG